jgi:N-acetylneuraminic acid mutarotase
MLTRCPLSVALALAAFLTMSIASGAAEPIGVWVPGPPMADARESHTATVLKDGRVLVVSAQAEEYDPVGNRWLAAATPPITLTSKTATLLDDGRVLVVGGIDSTTGRSVPNAELYHPGTNTWIAAGSMAGRRYDHTATLLRDGRVLIVGGTRSTVVLDSVEIYDPRTNAWSPGASLLAPRSEHIATLLQDGRVLVAGGNGDTGQVLTTAELYDPASNKWTPTGQMAVARHFFSATLLDDGAVLVAGGFPHPEQVGQVIAELFHPATETWSPAGSLTQPAVVGDGFAMTILRDGRVLICGGESHTNLAIRPTGGSIYDPRINSWSPTSDMTRGRVAHSASLLTNGRVLVAGGRDNYVNGTPMNSTEFFDYPVSPKTAAPTETVDSRVTIEPLVAGGIAVITVIALLLITPPLIRRWRRRRGI